MVIFVMVRMYVFMVGLKVTQVAHEKFGLGCHDIVDSEMFVEYLVRLELFGVVEVGVTNLAVSFGCRGAVKCFQVVLQTAGCREPF